jgi:dihydroorotase
VLILGGRLVDPAQRIDTLRDVRITDVVTEIGEHLEPRPGEEVYDASGCFVAPGFIDMHVHLRVPGEPHKETLETGGTAALRGGFTAVACMPNTKPALDSPENLELLQREMSACCTALPRILPIAAITRERAGKDPCDYAALVERGAVAFSDDGATVADGRVLLDAARKALAMRAPFIVHCESPALAALSNALSESSIVARDVQIIRKSGKAWHFAHLSTRTAVEILRFARAQGVAATAEVTPHHLNFTADSVTLGPAARVNPSLAFETDVRALRDAVRDGTISVFASDHAPHTIEEKYGDKPAPGFTGLEVAIGAYALALPDLSLERFVAMLSCEPARILGIPGGTLAIGTPADITVFNDEPWMVDAAAFASKGKVTPFDGMTLPRKVVATIVGGRILYDARIAA